ncbi:DUF4097 family beta strand repeat-containing protein [Terriglobus sp. TAA 43]|uniref:DUF4097 family beta strand repeat-containing protein n=1 Tax=Terriglobus sp. TAA 43 TaxID=278961 RepID=UPI000646DD3E|nr:DUF4097 family beta strand repeat-containing protein [Terriglobus sp. TAA 43]
MSTTPPNQPPYPPSGDPNAPFDPTNVNDPRYDPSRDPRYDPRWQKAQQRFYRDQQRVADRQGRAQQKAAAAAWKMQARVQRDQIKMYWRGQRRTSLIGPILLITIGVIFFLIHSDKISAVGFFNWYAHWWPLLFIAVGVLRLAEWAIDRAMAPADAPPMRYSIGGGVIFVLVVLACVGLATHTLQWRADNNGMQFFGFKGEGMEHFFGQKHEEDAAPMLRTIQAGGSLSIVNPRGDISVAGTSDDGQIHLSVHKSVYTNSDNAASDRMRDLSPVFEGADDNLTLRVPTVQGGTADVTLLVPPATHLLLNSTRGDVHVTNMKAPLVVTSDNGDVEVAAITGPVQVHGNNRHHDIGIRSVAGDTTVDGTGNEVTLTDITGSATIHGDFFGGSNVQRVSGPVTYKSSRTDLSFARLYGSFSIDRDEIEADQVVGPALVQTRSRNVTLDKVSGELKVVNNHGDVRVDTALPVGLITIDNQNGSVTLTLPDKGKFNLQAETSDGDVHSEFGSTNSPGKGILTGNVNGGGPQVRINTSHGDISVSRNTTGGLTPPPAPQKLSGVPIPPTPPDAITIPMPDVNAITANALKQAEDALAASQKSLEDAKDLTREQRDQARREMEQAREKMKEAREKQKQADQLSRDAARRAKEQADQMAREARKQAP